MKIAVCYREAIPFSFRNYIENVTRELIQLGVDITRFKEGDPLPQEADLYWDPFSGPSYSLKKVKKPLVVSLLGDYGLGIPAEEFYGSHPLISSLLRFKLKTRLMYRWWSFRKSCSAIITVSDYSKGVVERHLRLDGKKVFPIYHGVNSDIFSPSKRKVASGPAYFLHVSQYVPPFHHMKNVNRIIEAYARLSHERKPRLVLVIPGYPSTEINVKGVELIRRSKTSDELATLYQGAVGFIFPSLHETFGMPILEAMACGCPVITSNVTACPEVAGDAALLVNPRSVDEITQAMLRLAEDKSLREELRQKGLARAKEFTWRKSAEKHLEVFRQVWRGK
ncbi:glycosyltransferase family 4 protein [Calderihabitans maritimus]|uniref:Similar to glycosyl transferase family 1 n=1 Tax=Calderihabitans maritimus TaxID=1246530 RepID=A0A1Z5HWW9_9FIRM|nr:glycosyltransferase family 1 protein [Calderihabitans maritimus]GAW94026.1 similar to glycosyl transferase family 1 [Calderihabitans maritimus]